MASLDPHRQIFVSRAEQQHPSPPALPPPPTVRSLHPSLPLDSDPNPRIAAFVRSQQQHSSFYRQEGLALFSGWLDDQRSKEEAAAAGKRTPSAKGKEREREKPRAPENEGIRAVDVLGGLGGGGASSSSAGLTGKGGVSSGESRVRMADRMRGKDGSSKKAGTSTSRKRRNDEDEGEESGGRPEGSEIVLTRRESEGRALGKDKVDAPSTSTKHLPPTSTHPPTKQPTASTSSKPLLVEASNSEDRPRDRDAKKRPRLDPVEEHNDDDDDESPPSPAAQQLSPPPPRKVKASSSKPTKNDPPPSPPPKASSSKPKSKSRSANEPSSSKPSKPSGKENLEAEEHAVRLEERKSRRRAKAEIVKPKPTAAASSSASSSAESDATDDADSRRKTRRVRKRKGSSSRRAAEEDESEESEGEARKRRKKEKEKAGGKSSKKKSKKENRDLGASIGMGLGIMDTFKAGNLGGGPSRRLTLKREVAKPGVFNKGRSSSKVVTKGKRSRDAVGVQDLVFSESRFLSRPRPPHNSASSASVDPEPQARPHRSSRSHHKSPLHPPPADKKRKARVVEDSDEPEEGSDDDRPVETVSKFFAVSKTKDKASKGKAREEPERQRVDSPSWPDVAEEDEESRRASEHGRSRNPAPSVHSTTRQGNGRSLSSRHAPSHDAASTSRSHHSQPQPQPQPPSSRRAASSHHSQPNPALSSKARTSGAPLPSSRPSNPPQQPKAASVDVLLRACETGRLPSPVRRGSQRQEKLVYDGTSSVGDYDVFVEIEVDGNGYNGCWDQEAEEWRGRGGRVDGEQEDIYSRSFDQPAGYLDGPSYDQDDHLQGQPPYLPGEDGLSDLGAEADVYRSAGHDFKTQTSSRRLHLPSRFDVEDLPFDQQPPQQQFFDDMEDDQPMQDAYQPNDDFDDDVGFDPPPFLDNNQFSPPLQASSSRNRAPFHPYSNAPQYQQQEEQFFSDEEQDERHPPFDEQQQQQHTLLSDIPDEEEEEDEGMFGAVEEEEEVDLRGHWRRHRT